MAIPLEDPGNLTDGGARGEDVVHQNQIGSRNSAGLPEPEGIADVPPSSFQVEPKLGQGRSRAAKTRKQWQIQSPAQASSQKERLVETSFSPAPRMGGHRYEPGWREGIGPLPVSLLEQGRQRMRQPPVAGKLVALDQLSQGSGVRSPSPSRMMEVSSAPAGRTGFKSLRICLLIRRQQVSGGISLAANRAETLLEPGQMQETFGT